KNVNYSRDFKADIVADIKNVVEGDRCPRCGAPLKIARGIEVGHIFKLGTKYSEALGATYMDEEGNEKPIVMGCYGIGINRTVAAIIEQHHDEKGIIWPMSVAPYHVIIVPVNVSDEEQKRVAEDIYARLLEERVEVLIDDRDVRAGVKFNDADLIGIPIRVTVGKKVKEGIVEIKLRDKEEIEEVRVEKVVGRIKEIIEEKLRELS
ncbi:MAG: His/Gly/Thr/Pro-type tRNA ligase C-terminal domain-containing protein, partial [Caldanaerobacter sp.]